MGPVMGAKKGSKKRFWSVEEKRSICAQTRVPGVSVAQVARRYAMNANLIHKWLRDPRFGAEEPIADDGPSSAMTFLPIEIEGVVSSPDVPDLPTPPAPSAALCVHRVDITLLDGRRILVEGTTALSAVLALVAGLAT